MARALTRSKPRPVRPEVPRSKWVRHAIVAAPAPDPATPPRPRGDLTAATINEIRDVPGEVWPKPDSRRKSRHAGLGRLLEHLSSFPGGTWQERWQASGLNEAGRPVRDLAAGDRHCYVLTQAVEALFSLRVIQPTLGAFRSNKFLEYPAAFRVAQADARLAGFFDAVEALDTSGSSSGSPCSTCAARSRPRASPTRS